MKYAIVESGGKQYRAVEGGTLEVDRLPDEPGANVKLEQILLVADGENVTVGTPLVQDTPVWTTVVEHFKGKKVTIFNYSPKKRIRVKTGHRQNYTRLLVEQIGGAKLVKKEPVKAEKANKAEVEVEEAVKVPKASRKAAPKTSTKTSTTTKTTKSAAKKPATKAPAAKSKKTTTTKPSAKK
jgi:large subunit ribosomal protein L21